MYAYFGDHMNNGNHNMGRACGTMQVDGRDYIIDGPRYYADIPKNELLQAVKKM